MGNNTFCEYEKMIQVFQKISRQRAGYYDSASICTKKCKLHHKKKEKITFFQFLGEVTHEKKYQEEVTMKTSVTVHSVNVFLEYHCLTYLQHKHDTVCMFIRTWWLLGRNNLKIIIVFDWECQTGCQTVWISGQPSSYSGAGLDPTCLYK